MVKRHRESHPKDLMQRVALLILGVVLTGSSLTGQGEDVGMEPARAVVPAAASVPVLPDGRIFGVIPEYQIVEKPDVKLPPLSTKEKFILFVKETTDPFTIFGAVMGASYSHVAQSDPEYGQGARGYRQRVGAAYADVATQNFFADSLLATLFKEDPRYYRLGPKASIIKRIGYSMSRVVVCRTDAGKNGLCFSSILGTSMGIALSNAYYPRVDQTGKEMASRVETSFSAAALTNLLPEFWPDIRQKLFTPKKPKN
jgi:hypothetical protein